MTTTDGQAHAHAPGHAHAHSHVHASGHAHAHPAGHDADPAQGSALLLPPKASAPVASLLMSSALRRLAGALGLTALLWAAVAWALAGTP